MKIEEAIQRFDALVYNDFSREEKVRWLSQLDGTIKKRLIDTHRQPEPVVWKPYGVDTDPETTELLVPEPFDELYMVYLEMQVYRYMQEYGKYNNGAMLFNELFHRYACQYAQTHEAILPQFTYC